MFRYIRQLFCDHDLVSDGNDVFCEKCGVSHKLEITKNNFMIVKRNIIRSLFCNHKFKLKSDSQISILTCDRCKSQLAYKYNEKEFKAFMLNKKLKKLHGC